MKTLFHVRLYIGNRVRVNKHTHTQKETSQKLAFLSLKEGKSQDSWIKPRLIHSLGG